MAPNFFNPKNSLNLFGLRENFDFISNLYLKNRLPKVLMLTGNKGSGKATLVSHFLHSIFDKENYDIKNLLSRSNSSFSSQFLNNIFSNIIYLSGSDFKSVKVEDIRILKKGILKSTISNGDRFIVFDDIEQFNQNSLNALLKIIEEPSKKNYFFLINNKSKPLLETIKSRAVEVKIILNEEQRLHIIHKLIDYFKIELVLDPNSSQLSPGNFVIFNNICKEYNIFPSNDFMKNLTLLVNLYKKNKDSIFINIIFFLADCYFKHLKKQNLLENEKIFEIKNFIFENLDNFVLYNINQNSLLNTIGEKLNYE